MWISFRVREVKSCLFFSPRQSRVGALVCTGKLMEHMDKWFVLDEVLPMVMAIPSREPAVLMGILGKKWTGK